MIRAGTSHGLDGAAWDDKLHASLASVGLNPRDVLGKYPHQL